MIAVLEIGTGMMMTVLGVGIAGLLLNVILAALSRCLVSSFIEVETEGADVMQLRTVGNPINPMGQANPVSS